MQVWRAWDVVVPAQPHLYLYSSADALIPPSEVLLFMQQQVPCSLPWLFAPTKWLTALADCTWQVPTCLQGAHAYCSLVTSSPSALWQVCQSY